MNPNVTKTWSIKGQTPIIKHNCSREKINVISCVTVSPKKQQFGLHMKFHKSNIKSQEVIKFFRHLLKYIKGNIVLILDGASIHRSQIVQNFLAKNTRLHIFRFLVYVPELNPDELVWAQSKRALSNTVFKNINQLEINVKNEIHRIKKSQSLLKSCINASALPWCI